MSRSELSKFFLSSNEKKMSLNDLKYLSKESRNKHDYRANGIDDKRLYHEIMETVDNLQLRDSLNDILRILFSILFIGNLDFDDSQFDTSI
jgi:myosin heavy subunit